MHTHILSLSPPQTQTQPAKVVCRAKLMTNTLAYMRQIIIRAQRIRKIFSKLLSKMLIRMLQLISIQNSQNTFCFLTEISGSEQTALMSL